MNSNIDTDIFFTKHAKFEQEKYRELKISDNSDNNINENIKSFEEIFTMYDDELKTSCSPCEAILIVDYKLNKRNKENKLYNFKVSYD